jgi:hypothetical protein
MPDIYQSKEKKMKRNDDTGMVNMIGFPHMEAWSVIEAIEQAEKNNDMKALKWCARRFVWLYEQGEVYSGGMFHNAEHLFNSTWKMLSENDPPPESIAAIVTLKDEPEPITAEAAEKALDTVKLFFEENLAKKGLSTAMNNIGILRNTIKKTEDEE